MAALFDFILKFLYFYPLFMAYVWMIGSIYYYYNWEVKDERDPDKPPVLPHYPRVSLIVPCHNEGDNARETIKYLANQDYPDFEVIAINDGSKDNTGEILDELKEQYPCLRVIHLAQNQGKAMGLRMGALISTADFFVCVDGDALLEPNATTWVMSHFIDAPRVGAVTGNPRIRTRSSLLGKIQVGEFSAIIGLMKRAQRIYGRIFTISGVVAGFRKAAIHRIGYWSTDMITEDIDVSWQLQLDHWDIRYEPNALCWILMPETIKGLWKQRLRWAQGGSEVILKYFKILLNWRKRRMWPVFLEYSASVCWSYLLTMTAVIWIAGYFLPIPDEFRISTLMPGWNGIILAGTCLLQFLVSLMIDGRYEKGLGKFYYWMIWYPLVYWILNVSTTIIAFPKAIFKKKGTRAIWVSPDRGIRT